MSVAYNPAHTCAMVVRDRACRNSVRESGALCWRHRNVTPVLCTLRDYRALIAEIDAALLNGADDRVWPPGLTRAAAITRLVTASMPCSASRRSGAPARKGKRSATAPQG